MTTNSNRTERFQAIVDLPETDNIPKSEAVQKLEREYRNCYPQEKFGEVSITLADIKGFVEPFEQTLEDGFAAGSLTAGDEFLAQGAASRGLDNIYVVKSAKGSSLAQKEPKAWEHHQAGSLNTYA